MSPHGSVEVEGVAVGWGVPRAERSAGVVVVSVGTYSNFRESMGSVTGPYVPSVCLSVLEISARALKTDLVHQGDAHHSPELAV